MGRGRVPPGVAIYRPILKVEFSLGIPISGLIAPHCGLSGLRNIQDHLRGHEACTGLIALRKARGEPGSGPLGVRQRTTARQTSNAHVRCRKARVPLSSVSLTRGVSHL